MNDFISVGIDVSKAALDIALSPESKPFRVENRPSGILQLLTKLPPPEACLVTLEGSGGYERLVIAELLDRGYHVALANPRQVRDFAKGIGILAKTDALDASVLARWAGGGAFAWDTTAGRRVLLEMLATFEIWPSWPSWPPCTSASEFYQKGESPFQAFVSSL
jgi:transposase